MDSGLATSTTTTPVAISTGPGSVAASAALASLSPGVRYYYRAVLTGAWGTVRGDVRDFLTPIFVWGEAGTSPIEGKLDATIIPNTTSSPVLYPNTSNRNFDVQLVTSGLGSNGLTTVLGEAAWWLEGSASSAPAPATVRVRFYRPGTTTPTALRGIHFRLEDAETNERCSDFSYFDADGNQVPLLWNSAAFTYSHKPRFNASGSEVENLAPTEGSIQHGKWIEIDLSGVAVSGFELRVKRMSVNNAGGIVMTALASPALRSLATLRPSRWTRPLMATLPCLTTPVRQPPPRVSPPSSSKCQLRVRSCCRASDPSCSRARWPAASPQSPASNCRS
jgi:hypothetical protein